MIITSEEFLRQRSSEVEPEEGEKIAEQLEEELKKSDNGVGISAPQIGILSRVVVLKINIGYLRLINPIIEYKTEPFIHENEGCLSFPGQWINTIRYHHITINDDLQGIQRLNNFAAVVGEHEIQHLDGILFFDRQVPTPYEPCFCGSEKKFKFCCFSKVR